MDSLSPEERSKRMGRVRSRNTKPELLVRQMTHRLGYRYRLHETGLPGKPDLVFASRQKIIFVNGCFWHRHPDPKCKLARLPKSRQDYWIPKLEANRTRDERVLQELARQGWTVLEIWECEIKNRERLENTIREFLDGQHDRSYRETAIRQEA